ncbi:MAG: TonB-dependent receptor, partial [Prevotellaceae bacterium]|jgi:TonB-linked SusC/RagA family outer membrane protein|nr:TonB-dependent receptor [Prevotellaceae bacterium]
VKGTTVAVLTDGEGRYTITVPENTTLVFSFVGMQTQEVEVGGRTVINMELIAEAKRLEDVIVVAYGTTTKEKFTGAVAVVKNDKLAKEQSSNVSKSLEGKVSGLQTFSSSGQPGSGASINIRGIGSISASQSPLIVLDGMPYEGSLNSINNADIESISVLKDAAASSLYGARGSNGVIMVTTKKGKTGKPQVTIENKTGFNDRAIPPYSVVESPKDYYELIWESIRNRRMYSQGLSAVNAGIYASESLVSTLGNYNVYNVPDNQLVDPLTGRLNPNGILLYQDNWYDEALSRGLRQETTLSIRGGTEKTKYYASLNYLYDNSYTVNSNFQRLSGRINMDQEVTSWFKMGANLAVANTTSNSPNVGSTTLSSIFFTGQMIAPIYPVYRRDANGNMMYNQHTGEVLYDYGTTEGHARTFASNSNAIAQQERDIRKYTSDVFNAKAYATISFLKDFQFTTNISIDSFNDNVVAFQTPDGGDAENVGGRGTKQMTRYYVINANQLLNWTKTFNDDHHVEVLLGHETKTDNQSYLVAQREKFFIPTNPELANAAALVDATGSSAGYSLEGYFGQVRYDYKSKYLFSASYRRDASSRFHLDSRWGDFWSVGASWRAKEEGFLKEADWLNELKIKASYGTQGNDNIGNNEPYKDQYQVVNQDGEIGLSYVFRGNPDITWEKSKNLNIGFETRLFDKLTVNFDYFIKETDDMIYYKPLPPSMGLPSSQIENSMAMKNTGIEIELFYDVIKTADWSWSVDFNLTHYVNELTKLPPDRPQDGWATGNIYRKIGSGAYNWYMYKWAGVDPQTGAPQYYADEKDADGNITGTKIVNRTEDATRYDLEKSAIPDVYGGLSTTVAYKGFDLSITAAYQIGGWVFDSPYQSLMTGGDPGQNFHTDIYDRWTPNNTVSNIPRLEDSSLEINGTSDRFLTKGTHLSLKNITLGYTLPKSVLSRIGIDSLKVYAVADNVWLFSARRGFDPRQDLAGGTGYVYAAVRTISFGFNVTF